MRVLTISNMGPKKSAPLLGLFVDNQISKLQQLGLDITYFNMKWNGDSMFHKIFKYPYFFSCFLVLHTFFRKKYDVIHVHYYYPTILCAYFYKRFINSKVKIVVTCHGGDVYCYEGARGWYERCISIVDHWIFTSRLLREKFRFNVNSHSVLSAGFDDDVFYFKPKNQKLEYDCILVGAVNTNKGVDRLLKVALLAPELKFAVVGEGNDRRLLEQNKPENVSFLGTLNKNELADLFLRSGILLSLSRLESFGLVMAEAHATGTVVIATETDGSIEQIKDQRFLIKQELESELPASIVNTIYLIKPLMNDANLKLETELVSLAQPYGLNEISIEIKRIYEDLTNKHV